MGSGGGTGFGSPQGWGRSPAEPGVEAPPRPAPPQHKRPGKGQRQPSPKRSPDPAESNEFSSFLYWRAPLPSIEDELQELLVSCRVPLLAASAALPPG